MKKYKKQLKLNTKNLIIMVITIIAFILFINDWMIALFNWGCFTYYGLLTNIIFLMVAVAGFDYLEEYTTKKELKKKYTQPRK